MTSELEEMAENIAAAEKMMAFEVQYLKEHPKDFIGLAYQKFQMQPGHYHEIVNVLAANKYFFDETLLEYAIRLTMGQLSRSLGRR